MGLLFVLVTSHQPVGFLLFAVLQIWALVTEQPDHKQPRKHLFGTAVIDLAPLRFLPKVEGWYCIQNEE